MAKITEEEIYGLARMVGIELDDDRSGVILARLNRLIEELDKISEVTTFDAEPSSIFAVAERERDDKL